MERKYYLRGLGLGIAVTAIIMGIAMPDSRAMTNDEIIARAKELGLVENTVLSDAGNADDLQENEADDRPDARDETDQPQDDLTAADSDIDKAPGTGDAEAKEDEDGNAADAEGEIALEANNAGQTDANPKDAAGEEILGPEGVTGGEEQGNTTIRTENNVETENANEAATSTTVRVITINSGDSSYTVAKKLADVGVVTSAQNFDTFLCQNGYDKRLRTGSFSIPANASDEQIARIVTGLE